MVKRLMLGALLATMTIGFSPAPAATCVAGGPYYHASATFTDAGGHEVTIYGEALGTFATGAVAACSDGTAGMEASARPLMTITVDGVEKCRRTDASSRLTSDPVVHAGGAVKNPEGSGVCGANVLWDALISTPTAGVGQTVGADTGGAQVTPFCRSTSFSGIYWLDGGEPLEVLPGGLPLPVVAPAYFCESGAKVAVDSVGI